MKCEGCHQEKFQKAGWSWRAGHRVQRWRCVACGRTYTEGALPRQLERLQTKIDALTLEAMDRAWEKLYYEGMSKHSEPAIKPPETKRGRLKDGGQ